jgi:hypothetical protein
MEDDPNVMWTYDATQVHSYTTHPSGNVIISFGNKLIEITGNTGQFIREIATIEDQPTITLTQLTTSQDGKYLAAQQGTTYLIDYQSGQILKRLYSMDCPNFFPDNNRMLLRSFYGHIDSLITVYNIQEDYFTNYYSKGFAGVKQTLSLDGKYLATSTFDDNYSYFYLWDAETMKPIRLLEQGDNTEYRYSQNIQITFSDYSAYVGYGSPTGTVSRAANFKINDTEFKKIYSQQRICFINETYLVGTNTDGINKAEIREVESDKLVFSSKNSASVNNYSHDKINKTLLIKSPKGLQALDLSKLITSVSDQPNTPEPKISYLKGILSIEADFINPVTISIIDMTGKTVKSFPPQPINQRIDFPINLIAGAYIVKVGDFSSKIMVAR